MLLDMQPKLKLKTRESLEDLRRAVRESDNEAQKTRLRAILCIKEGLSHAKTAKQFVVCRTTMWSWVRAYNQGGIKALKMSEGGRPVGSPKWDPAIFTALTTEIDKGGKYWSIPLMQIWIKERYRQDIPEQTVWYRLNALRYSYKSARPHPFKGDAEKQAAFKKGAPAKLRF